MTNVKNNLEEEIDEQAHKELLKDLEVLNKKNKGATSTHVVRLNPDTALPFNAKKLASKLSSIFLDISLGDFEPLLAPLEKPSALRVKRALGFEELVDDVNKWESIVDKHRHAEQITFPLNHSDIGIKTDEIDLKPTMKTSLEKEVYTLLTSSQPKPKDPDTKDVEAAQRAKALRELRLETAEVIRRRNTRLRLEKKMSLLKKSKSRKYHQILRRERMRKQKETFERLRTTDPQAALEILQEIEKERIKERLTLRHRNSKWVQTLQARSKHDPEARAALQENAEMRTELLKKVKDLQHEQEGALQEQENLIAKGVFGESNAWLSQLARVPAPTPVNPEEEKSFGEMKRFWEDFNRRREADKEAQKVVEELEKRAEVEEREDADLTEEVSSSPVNSEEGAGRPQDATTIPSVKKRGRNEGEAVARAEAPAKMKKKRKVKIQEEEEILPSSKMMKKGEENSGQQQKAPPIKGKNNKSAITGIDSTQKGKKKKNVAINGRDSTQKDKSEGIDGNDFTPKSKKKKSEGINGINSTQKDEKKKSEGINGNDSTPKSKKKKSEGINGSDSTPKGKKKKSEGINGNDSTPKSKKKKSEGINGNDSTPKGKKKKSEGINESDSTHKESQVIETDASLNLDTEVDEEASLPTSPPQKVPKSKEKKGGTVTSEGDLPDKDQLEASSPPRVEEQQEAPPQKLKNKKIDVVPAEEENGKSAGVERLLAEAFVDEVFDRAEKSVIDKVAKASFEEKPPPSDAIEPLSSHKDDFEFDLTIKDNETQINECLPGEELAPEPDVAPTPDVLKKEPLNQTPSGAASVVNIRDGDVLKMNPRPMGQSAWAEITALSDDEEVDVGDSKLVQLFEDDEENLKAFKTKKEEEGEETRVKDVDMFQDGWGSWTGPGIEPVKPKKKRKHILEAPPHVKHPYNKLGNVIYREESDVHSNLRKLMVSQLPFPFTRVQDFEASVRQSIGRQFVPEDLHRKLIKPRVVTKMGVVIPPMDKDTLLKHEKRKKMTTLEKKLDQKLKKPVLINRKSTKKRKTTKIKKLSIK